MRMPYWKGVQFLCIATLSGTTRELMKLHEQPFNNSFHKYKTHQHRQNCKCALNVVIWVWQKFAAISKIERPYERRNMLNLHSGQKTLSTNVCGVRRRFGKICKVYWTDFPNFFLKLSEDYKKNYLLVSNHDITQMVKFCSPWKLSAWGVASSLPPIWSGVTVKPVQVYKRFLKLTSICGW